LKNTQISNFMKSIQWVPSYSKLMEGQTEDGQVRQTDMTKLMVTFCNVVSMPKISHHDSQLLGQESRQHSKYNARQPITQLHIMSDRQRKCMSITFLCLETLEETYLICNHMQTHAMFKVLPVCFHLQSNSGQFHHSYPLWALVFYLFATGPLSNLSSSVACIPDCNKLMPVRE